MTLSKFSTVWASDVSAIVTAPNGSKQIIGWTAGERPPADYENWLVNSVQTYLNAAIDSINEWYDSGETPTVASQPTFTAKCIWASTAEMETRGNVDHSSSAHGLAFIFFLGQLTEVRSEHGVAVAGGVDSIVQGDITGETTILVTNSGGIVTMNNLQPAVADQRVTILNSIGSVNNIVFAALVGGFPFATATTLQPGDGVTFQYSSGDGAWYKV
jgi:hypothetical protein